MNFCELHLGDYAEATAHLTFVEDAAYSRLIRKYYAKERPIPADLKAAQRLVGARTPEEQDAVNTVLEEFFTLQHDGWHNKRCDQELVRYRDKRDKARASAQISVSVRRERSEAFGQRSLSEGSTDAQRTLNGRSAETAPVEPTPQSGRRALQSPVSSPHINPKRPVDNGDNSAQRARLPMEGAGAAKSKGLARADLKELLAELQPGRERSDG